MGTECCSMKSLMLLSFCLFSWKRKPKGLSLSFEERYWGRNQPPFHVIVAQWERPGSNTSSKSGPHTKEVALSGLSLYVCLLVCLTLQYMDSAEEPQKECCICLVLPSNCTVSTKPLSWLIFHWSWCFSTESFGFNKSALSNREVFRQRNSPNI